MKKMTKKELEIEINELATSLPIEHKTFFLHICVSLLAYGFLTGQSKDTEEFKKFQELVFETAEHCNNLYQKL